MLNQDKIVRENVVFGILYNHIYSEYHLPYASKGANWFKDLNLTQYQFDTFCEWIEKEFNIVLPVLPYENIGDIVKTICDIEEKQKREKNSIFNRIKNVLLKKER